jgi:DMSO/TMAO reductase YedYZ heme-binding membrane subunit
VHGRLLWYVARSAGLVAWGLLALSVGLGVLLGSRLAGKRPSPAWLLSIHRFLGGLASIFVLVHVLGIVADSYVHFRLVDVLVPFASSWHPVAVAWGVVAMWLLVAVELTSLARSSLPRQVWRAVHMSSYPLFLLASVHMLSAGTDAFTAPVRALVVGGTLALTALATLALWRSGQAAGRGGRINRSDVHGRPSAASPNSRAVYVNASALDGQ